MEVSIIGFIARCMAYHDQVSAWATASFPYHFTLTHRPHGGSERRSIINSQMLFIFVEYRVVAPFLVAGTYAGKLQWATKKITLNRRTVGFEIVGQVCASAMVE